MMHIDHCSEDGSNVVEPLTALLGPAQVDHFTRQALQFCWMALPKDRRNLEELERLFRRIVERALEDFREDSVAFGQARGQG